MSYCNGTTVLPGVPRKFRSKIPQRRPIVKSIIKPYNRNNEVPIVKNTTTKIIKSHNKILKEQETDKEKEIRKKKEEDMTKNVVKKCLLCGKSTFKDGGCNYMKCSDSEPKSNCPQEWCWLCYKPKYKHIKGKEFLGFCDDKSHNSH